MIDRPPGSAMASRIGSGVQGPVASIVATKPGVSAVMMGAGAPASASNASPANKCDLRDDG